MPPRVVRLARRDNAKVSKTALAGVVWASLFFVIMLLSTVQLTLAPGEAASGPAWRKLLHFTLIPLGFAAPFATTVLGLIAIGRVRRSDGRLYGLSLALFDALLFPLLLLNVLVFWVSLQIDSLLVAHDVLSVRTSAVIFRHTLPTILCVLGDYHLATRAWAAIRPGARQRREG